MKRFLSIRLAVVAMAIVLGLLSGPQTAKAVVIATENFSYANGALSGANGDFGWSTAWSGTATVSGGVAVTGNTNGFRNLTTPIVPTAGQRVYARMNFSADPSQVNDFAGLSFFSGAGERALIGLPFNLNTYGWNVTGASQAGSSVAASTTPVDLLGEFIFNSSSNLTLNVYLNTAAGLGSPISTYTGSMATGNWDRIRIASGTLAGTSATFDNIRIGTTLGDVGFIPEPTTLLGVVASGGLFMMRRRRMA